VALGRAAHQVFDNPRVFDDPLALRIVGAYSQGRTPETFFRERYKRTVRASFLRAVVTVRSRIAEDELARAITSGVRQYVLLGAGLDTFAYRNPYSDLRVFEVDHPATQGWKRQILHRARIAEPDSLTFVPVDFERQTAMEGLSAAGFDRALPACFAWLGVTMYLQEEVVYAVLRDIAALAPASSVTFDYALAKSEMGLLSRLIVALSNRRLKRIGEPWITFFNPPLLASKLRSIGFRETRNLGPGEINRTYFAGRSDGLRVSSVAHVMIASV